MEKIVPTKTLIRERKEKLAAGYRTLELSPWEFEWLSQRVGAALMTCIGHGDKLFPKELEDKERVRALSHKFG